MAIPLAGLLAVTGYGVYLGSTQSAEASGLQERTDLALSSYRLIDALQAERRTLIESKASTPELRDAVQGSADALAARATGIGGELEELTERALGRVEAAQRVSGNELGGRVALASYSAAIDELLDLSTVAIDTGESVDDSAASTADYLARAQAASAQERDMTMIAAEEGALDATSFQALMGLASAQESYTALAAASAPTELGLLIQGVGYSMSAADSIRRDVFTERGARDFTSWTAGLDQRTATLTQLQQVAETDAVAVVDDFASWSRQLLFLAAVAAIAIVLISALLLRRAIRSIARPLQDLAAQAEEVATTRLPEAVKAQQDHGGDELHLPALRATGAAEVHEVAAAFNDVQDTALRLASEQAALRVNQSEAMTNLGRRNQTLLARQLDFITSLETRETDPAFLEHLFKLDHLASRMRRNAESLLILAGSETPRRRRAPAPVAEVVRAAMSEVEDFERVRIGHLREATLSGPVVIDLIHLLSELIENALNFSPPDSTVEIDGRSLGQGGYQLAIIDHGVGMSDVELLAANQRISGLDELEGMPTRYLGQYVVAKLASKTGTHVRLQPSSGGRGVTAIVTLPVSAVIGSADRSAVSSPMPGSKASREQGPVPFAPGAGVATAAISNAPSASPSPSPVPTGINGSSDVVPFETTGRETSRGPAMFETFGTEPRSTTPAPFNAAAFEETSFDAAASFDPASSDAATFDASPSSAPVSEWTASGPAGSATDDLHASAFSTPGTEPVGIEPAEVGSMPSPTTIEPAVADELSSIWNARPADPAAVPSEDQWARFETELDEAPAQPEATAPAPVDSGQTSRAADPFADVSPPAPAEPPTQHEWRPNPTEAVSSQLEPVPSQPEPVSPSPLTAAQQQFGGGGRPGGLSKRVPGASLAESRRGDTAGAPVQEVDRSADGVRSMLSSFQAGRSRGRVAPGAAPSEQASDGPSGDPTAPTTPLTHDGADRAAQDGRSSQ
ncbi:MAG: ATP-binding protein [Actinomycetota bacterium]|nr:ATP-binding protein [Actinomycetota bacterium]